MVAWIGWGELATPVSLGRLLPQDKTDQQQSDATGQNGGSKDAPAQGETEEKPRIRFELGKNRDTGPELRARRPQLDQQVNPFFKDFQAEALVGSPPDWSQLSKMGKPGSSSITGAAGSEVAEGAGGFDSLISSSVMEDEIKKSANLLTTQITTPVKFRSDYRDVHQTYSQLAALFAINEVYAGEVRWHDDAPAFRELMGRTAAGTRVSTPQAYQMALQTREDLQQIIRGGRASVSASGEPLEDWGGVVDRTPMMSWLEQLATEEMRQFSSDEETIKENQSELLHDAELVAAIAQLLVQPEMDEYDDDDYAAHAQAMKRAALEVKNALELQDYQGVQDAVNSINQSCDDCHADFR